MKVGILTFHYSKNYGAVLQAYALSQYLESLGHIPLIINYEPVDAEPHSTAKKKTFNLRLFLMGQYIRIMGAYSGYRLKNKFSFFIDRYLPMGKTEFFSLTALKENPPLCDAYVCGSDQIWNPHGRTFNPAYFLKFGKKEIHRISYAASFGTSVIPDYLQEELQNNLSELDYISVRESSGVFIVNRISDKPCKRVLDPTLLLNSYSCSVPPKSIDEDYVFVYRLQQNHQLTKSLTSVVRKISKILSAKVINVSPHRYRFFLETGKTIFPSPEEWLGLIERSKFVATNSFHGTVFAIINKKPFISFPRVNKGGQNGRIQELLSDLGLNERFINANISGNEIDTLINQKIDWDAVYLRLDKLRKESHSFLSWALGNKNSV